MLTKKTGTRSIPGVHGRSLIVFVLLALVFSCPYAAPITLTDDSGNIFTLDKPAQRIISLAPNITELLFAAGAGSTIVGTVEHSDFPPEAMRIPRIGNHTGVDIEAIIALQPDAIMAWPSGNPQSQIQTLKQLQLPVFDIDPRHLDDIPDSIIKLGLITDTSTVATASAAAMRMALTALYQNHQQRPSVAVFFQIWEQPLYTINGRHMISDVIQLCGGHNVFANLASLSPRISIEAVIQANPDVIITSTEDGNNPQSLQYWRQWPRLKAAQNKHLYGIAPDAISISSPRILTGARRLCQLLQQVRTSQHVNNPDIEPQ